MNLKTILDELGRRQKPSLFILNEFLFKEQLDFVLDPAPFKTAVCSRRSGKTIACAADLLNKATTEEGIVCLYITLSRSNAKKIIWRELKKLNKKFELGGKPNEQELSMEFSNGSFIYCSGAKDKGQIENFRGLPIRRAYLDESQSFPQYIKDLIDDVLEPALMDYNGDLILIGTPGPVPAGYFFDCAHSSAWSHHAWTFFQNPHISLKSKKTHQQVFERVLKRRGISADDPSIQREWFGKWALDRNSLVYQYNESVNHYETLPIENYTYIMGVDFGFEDADAIAILAWSEKSPITYLVEELVINKQGITPLVSQIEALQKRFPISKIVADFGGLGKKIAEEITRRWQIPLVAAEKQRKNETIEIFNDSLRTGHFKAKNNSRFAMDSMLVEWDKDKSTPEKKTISNRFHSDICDAVIYSYKYSPAFSWTPEAPKPKYGTPEWMNQQVDEMEQAAIDYFENQSKTI